MKKLYIIPGWEETIEDKKYQKVISMAREKGFEVTGKNVNWKQNLSEQIFLAEEESVIFGFSLGAVLARLIAQKYSCKHLILASMTPLSSFSEDIKTRKALCELVGDSFVDSVDRNLEKSHKAERQTVIYGDQENEEADVLVPNTDHEINDAYIKEIGKLI